MCKDLGIMKNMQNAPWLTTNVFIYLIYPLVEGCRLEAESLRINIYLAPDIPQNSEILKINFIFDHLHKPVSNEASAVYLPTG